MKRLIALLIICALALAGCAGSPFSPLEERESPQGNPYLADIPPTLIVTSGETQSATAYFRLGNEGFLVPVRVTFELAFGQSVEEVVIRRMLSGPGDMHDLTSLFPWDMELTEVNEKSGYLEVVLSRDLDSPSGDKALELKNRLAVYSIVNAVTELGKYSRVMFMILDKSGSPVRMTLESAGILPVVEGEHNSMDPLPRNPEYILTPYKVADLVLSAMKSQDAESVDTIRRYSIGQDALPPDEYVVSADLFGEGTISDFTIKGEPIVAPDGLSALALVDYDSLSAGQRHTSHTDISLRLVRDGNSVWKVDYESLCALKAVNY